MAAYPGAPTPYGNYTHLGITSATVVKTGPGVVVTVVEIVSGSSSGAVYDSTSTTGNSAANQVAVIGSPGPANGLLPVNMPCINGIVVVPGTGQTVAISYI